MCCTLHEILKYVMYAHALHIIAASQRLVRDEIQTPESYDEHEDESWPKSASSPSILHDSGIIVCDQRTQGSAVATYSILLIISSPSFNQLLSYAYISCLLPVSDTRPSAYPTATQALSSLFGKSKRLLTF